MHDWIVTDTVEIRCRLKAKQRCFIARLKGQIVHTGWAFNQQARITYLDRMIQLAPDEIYIDESFTANQLRGVVRYESAGQNG